MKFKNLNIVYEGNFVILAGKDKKGRLRFYQGVRHQNKISKRRPIPLTEVKKIIKKKWDWTQIYKKN